MTLADRLPELLDRARRTAAWDGYSHRSSRVELDGRPVLVRIPIEGREDMDVRIWRERDVLPVVGAHGARVPRLLVSADEPDVLVLEYVDGDVVHVRWPRGVGLPQHFAVDVVELLATLQAVPVDELPQVPRDWPSDGDVDALFRLLVDKTESIHEDHRPELGWLYEALGMPSNPLGPVRDLAGQLASRPFALCHCDLSRKNCVSRDGRIWFLDWELALLADPAYDVATHLHKTGHRPDEEERLLALLERRLPPRSVVRLSADVAIYRAHERVKSIVVDAVRYHRRISLPSTTEPVRAELCASLAHKLNEVAPLWDSGPWEPRAVAEVLRP
jgi:aminoglycoside phosphotransferase (APT) family kinase protein